MTTGELTTILSWLSLGTGVAAIINAYAALQSQKFARKTVREMQEAREPSVYLELEFPSHQSRIVVGNYGLSPALNVRFTVQDNAPWRAINVEPKNLSEAEVVQNGISFLGPGRTLRYIGGSLDWARLTKENGDINIEITFENEAKRTFTKRYEINLAYTKSLRFDTYKDTSHEITEAIREMSSNQMIRGSQRQVLPTITTQRISCPVCAEGILPAAKKCRYCHSVIPHIPPANGASMQSGQTAKVEETQ